MALIVVLIILVCPFAAMLIASGKGRSGLGWFCLGLLLGPFAVLGAAMISPSERQRERAGLQSGKLCKCIACAEPIQREAMKCKHCGTVQPAQPQRRAPLSLGMDARLDALEAAVSKKQAQG